MSGATHQLELLLARVQRNRAAPRRRSRRPNSINTARGALPPQDGASASRAGHFPSNAAPAPDSTAEGAPAQQAPEVSSPPSSPSSNASASGADYQPSNAQPSNESHARGSESSSAHSARPATLEIRPSEPPETPTSVYQALGSQSHAPRAASRGSSGGAPIATKDNTRSDELFGFSESGESLRPKFSDLMRRTLSLQPRS